MVSSGHQIYIYRDVSVYSDNRRSQAGMANPVLQHVDYENGQTIIVPDTTNRD